MKINFMKIPAHMIDNQRPFDVRDTSRSQSFHLFFHLYIFIVMMLLPVSWFEPTGLLLREFGAKPAAPLLTIGGLVGLISWRKSHIGGWKGESFVLLVGALLIFTGACAFAINQLAGWSAPSTDRSPWTQFTLQSLLVIAAFISVAGNARLMRTYLTPDILQNVIVSSAICHILIFALEAAGLLVASSFPLELFRTDGSMVGRPSGLMHEPSYFGAGAALFAGLLLAMQSRPRNRLIYMAIASLFYLASLSINAKTALAVIGAQLLWYLLKSSKSFGDFFQIPLLISIFVAVFLYISEYNYMFDVYENLSSNMRIGSTFLSLAVAANGYAISGVGIGQFHFFYTEEFAPHFLTFSREFYNQTVGISGIRASTFNFFTRVLVEFGIIGFSIMLFSFYRVIMVQAQARYHFITTMLVGSFGFLMTQDPYFYPPLIFAIAVLISNSRNAVLR